uniref:TLC domain-containing protein n=1 Tax=Pseudonaja textilis TaxID=8673 RepID=A0A670ZWZ6_PSETE
IRNGFLSQYQIFFLLTLSPIIHPCRGDPWLVKLNVAVTCGYLLYDLLLLVRYWKTLGDSLFVCHHLVALYAYGYVLSRGVLPYFANFRLLSELSTPFVNLRWFLDATGWSRTSRLVLANGLAMMVVFFMVRIAVIPSYYMQVYSWSLSWMLFIKWDPFYDCHGSSAISSSSYVTSPFQFFFYPILFQVKQSLAFICSFFGWKSKIKAQFHPFFLKGPREREKFKES